MILPADILAALIRLVLVLLIYLFLYQVVRALLKDLRQSSAPHARIVRLVPIEGLVAEPFVVRGRATIGRASDADIVLSDSFVSSQHAVIFWDDGQWWISDLASTNGTLVNGQSVPDTISLQAGDQIQFGGIVLGVAPPEAR